MNILTRDVQVYILAGGLSSRMGSDKGMLVWNGKTFISHILHTLSFLFEHIVIISNNATEYHNLGCIVINDTIKDIGPIGGIYTGLQHSKKELNLFVTCDAPLLSHSFFKEFLKTSDRDKINFCTISKKVHPLPVMINKKLLSSVEENIQHKIYKLWSFYQQNPYRAIEMNQFEKEMMNINTPEDYNALISQ